MEHPRKRGRSLDQLDASSWRPPSPLAFAAAAPAPPPPPAFSPLSPPQAALAASRAQGFFSGASWSPCGLRLLVVAERQRRALVFAAPPDTWSDAPLPEGSPPRGFAAPLCAGAAEPEGVYDAAWQSPAAFAVTGRAQPVHLSCAASGRALASYRGHGAAD